MCYNQIRMKMSRRALKKRTCRAGGKKRTLNRTCRSKVRRGGFLDQLEAMNE